MRLLKAKLVKRDICGCGFGQVREDIPLGKEYIFDYDSIRDCILECGGCHKETQVWVALTYDENSEQQKGWFVLDALEPSEVKHFTCAMCHQECDSPPGYTEEMALQESWKIHGPIPIEQMARVCDECHQRLLAWKAEQESKGVKLPSQTQQGRVN